MSNALWNNEPFARVQCFDSTGRAVGRGLQIDEQPALDDVEEFVIIGMLVPMVLAFDDAESNDGIVHANERLVVPRVPDGIDDGIQRDLLERRAQNIEMCLVRER